ncbi:glutamyl aminopeptidase-like [Saccoglossus kowalevskii]|uniref:Glutamyl aminopeptidase-like n=1 Tax=Saccoglossus kowalevskii TaxID=10224 RepID=A0ABM0MMC3_SACKO|nr:PREDICTED: glutamyl aminopeptidase-like [Saccoglossus kowalevskii]
MSRNSSYPPPPPRTRSRQTTYDNPMMTNYAVQTEDIPRYVPHYASRPQQTHSPPTTISTVDAVVRPPSRPPSERSDYPSESIKFEENKGFFLSYWRAALIAIGVVLLLLLVGLLVGFLKPGPTPPSNVTVTGAPPTLDPSKSWNHLRLPDTMEPIEYDLHLRINVDAARFNGSVSMTVRILQDTDEVLVHAMTLDVTQSSVSVAEKDSKRNVPITNQFVFELHNYYVIELGETLKSDESYVITFGDFTGRLLPDMTGLYLSPYRMAGQERFIVASFFEPSFARKAFPCFDEPALKAVFRVNITHPRYNRETVLFNTELESTIDADTGWVTEIFKETQKMSTYLLGFALGDLQKLEVVRQGGHTVII